MGVFQNLLNNAKTFTSTDQIASFLQSKINSQVDPASNAAAAATNTVHSWGTSTQTSGSCSVLFELQNGETFSTGQIEFDDTAATIETAIDLAATSASITGWTNGDISVSGTAVNNGPIVFTFDGDSVSGLAHPSRYVTDQDGAGGAWGGITVTTQGQSERYALNVLIALGALDDGTIAERTADASNSGFAAGANIEKVPQWVVRALGREMAAEDDNNNTYHTVVESLAIQDRARSAQRIGNSSVI